jgi:Domain of unknown function (DUF4440)
MKISSRILPLLLLLAAIPLRSADSPTITQEELIRRTQEIVDSVTSGDQKPWKLYIADDCMFFDEKGRSMDKAALVKDVAPLPTGYSGNIKVVKAQSRIIGTTAILSYDLDETETIFGQELHARYHSTDTWLYRDARWQIIAVQVLRYYEDPAPAKLDPKSFDLYLGTYELAPGVTLTITRDANLLFRQRGNKLREELVPEAVGIFFRKGVEGRILFPTSGNGRVDTLIDRRNNEDVVWKKIN